MHELIRHPPRQLHIFKALALYSQPPQDVSHTEHMGHIWERRKWAQEGLRRVLSTHGRDLSLALSSHSGDLGQGSKFCGETISRKVRGTSQRNTKARATQQAVKFDIQIINILHVEFSLGYAQRMMDSLHIFADVCAWPSNLCGEANSWQPPPDSCWRQCPIKVQSSANKRVALTGNSNSNFNSDQASGNGKNKNTSIIVTGSFKSHGEQLLPKDVSASFVKEPGILVWPKFYTKML